MTDPLRPLFSILILGGLRAVLGQTPTDLVVLHGKIYTENPSQPRTEALAIRAGQAWGPG